MAIRVRLADGAEFVVQAKLAEWDAAFRKATAANAMLEIQLPDGSIRPIDPRSIESFREEPEAAAGLEAQFRAAATA
jgi:hypothetical protein